MKQKNNLKLIGIFGLIIIFLFIQIYFVNPVAKIFQNIQGIEYSEIEEDGTRLTFVEEDVNLNISGNLFINIIPQDDAEHPTYIDLDKNEEIINADFTVNDKGGIYVFGNTEVEVPPNSRVFFDKDEGVRIKIPEEGELEQLPQLKDDSKLWDYITTIEGDNIKLPEGVVMSGKLNYENNQFFVAPEERVEINGIEVDNTESSESLKVFFDGKEHSGDYISLDLDNKKLILESFLGGSVMNFREDNPFIQIDKGDHFVVQPLSNSKIEIQNRDSLGLIPKVMCEGDFRIEEDYKTIYNEGDKIDLINSAEYYAEYGSTTSPVEILISNKEHKYVFDNFNRIATAPKDVEEFLVSSKEGIVITFSSRLKYNYITEKDIEKLTGLDLYISDEIPQGNKDMVLGRFRDYYPTLTPETKESIRFIRFWDEDSMYEERGPLIYAFADPGIMTFRADESFNLEHFRHESAHELLFGIEGEGEIEKMMDIRKKMNENVKKNKELRESLEEASSIKEKRIIRLELRELNRDWNDLYKEYKEMSVSSFRKEWGKKAGIIYGKISVKNESGSWVYKREPEETGPRYGLVSTYGGKSLIEDVATYVGKANDPCFFECLINPECKDYEVRYREKLDLLNEYQFMSENEYNEILECAKVK